MFIILNWKYFLKTKYSWMTTNFVHRHFDRLPKNSCLNTAKFIKLNLFPQPTTPLCREGEAKGTFFFTYKSLKCSMFCSKKV